MENTIGFAGVAGAIFISFAVALGIEWLSLVLLMKMMPASSVAATAPQKLSPVPDVRKPRGSRRIAA